MRIKPPERAFTFSPKGGDLFEDLGVPYRYNIAFVRHGVHYLTAKAVVVDKGVITLYEKGNKKELNQFNLWHTLYRRFGGGARLIPVCQG